MEQTKTLTKKEVRELMALNSCGYNLRVAREVIVNNMDEFPLRYVERLISIVNSITEVTNEMGEEIQGKLADE